MAAYRRILVPLDFSEASARALDAAVAFARAFGAELHVLHVVPLNGLGEREAEAELSRAAPSALDDVVRSRRAVRALAPELGILEAAAGGAAGRAAADLIVMGTHGRSGFRHVMIGSVAERVVQLASCPVLTLRRPGHTFVHP